MPRFVGLPPHRGVSGHIEAMVLYAGDGLDGITSVLPAAAVVEELAADAERLLRAW